jgi:hypothetical protein
MRLFTLILLGCVSLAGVGCEKTVHEVRATPKGSVQPANPVVKGNAQTVTPAPSKSAPVSLWPRARAVQN